MYVQCLNYGGWGGLIPLINTWTPQRMSYVYVLECKSTKYKYCHCHFSFTAQTCIQVNSPESHLIIHTLPLCLWTFAGIILRLHSTEESLEEGTEFGAADCSNCSGITKNSICLFVNFPVLAGRKDYIPESPSRSALITVLLTVRSHSQGLL